MKRKTKRGAATTLVLLMFVPGFLAAAKLPKPLIQFQGSRCGQHGRRCSVAGARRWHRIACAPAPCIATRGARNATPSPFTTGSSSTEERYTGRQPRAHRRWHSNKNCSSD